MVERHALLEKPQDCVILPHLFELLVATEVEAHDVSDVCRLALRKQVPLDRGSVVLALLAREHEEQGGEKRVQTEGFHEAVHAVHETLNPHGSFDGGVAVLATADGLGEFALLVVVALQLAEVRHIGFAMKPVALVHDHFILLSAGNAVLERYYAVLGGYEVDGALLEVAHPLREPLGAVDGRGQHYQIYGGRQEHDTFLPHLAAVGVVDVVHFVEHHGIHAVHRQRCGHAQRLGRCSLLEQQVAQDLGGHDDDVGVRAELDIARHHAYAIGVDCLEVAELLVGKRLDGCRVKRALALGKRMLDLVLADQSLAAARLGSDENVLVVLDRVNRLLLKRIQGKGVVCLDFGSVAGRGNLQHSSV